MLENLYDHLNDPLFYPLIVYITERPWFVVAAVKGRQDRFE